MQGYGGATVQSLGRTNGKIKIDEVERDVPIVVVEDKSQEFDLLIGRPLRNPQILMSLKQNII